MVLGKKIAFVCNDCGGEHNKWQGQCAHCGAWNTLEEIRFSENASSIKQVQNLYKPRNNNTEKSSPKILADVQLEEISRIATTFGELDRVLGGGLVPGSVTLLGGSPGAGKSTLLLQLACSLSDSIDIFYVSGEESMQQVALRANRLALPHKNLHLMSETKLQDILSVANDVKPTVLVIDSIQVMYLDGLSSAPGGVSQVRECSAVLTQFAKQSGTVLILVGHVTKDGLLAGPKVLEHIVDCSLLLEGDANNRFRTLRSQKNRFGAVNELGVFAMTDRGMREVKNPSAIFLDRTGLDTPGSVVTIVWEGTRPLLVEIQALIDPNTRENPRRLAVGLDQNRMSMLLAVLHRHGGVNIVSHDIYTNVVGGIRVLETSTDLALIFATVSSLRDFSLPSEMAVFGEVGLSGEVRPVQNGQERLLEARKHGFKRALIPVGNAPKTPIEGLDIEAVSNVSQALSAIC